MDKYFAPVDSPTVTWLLRQPGDQDLSDDEKVDDHFRTILFSRDLIAMVMTQMCSLRKIFLFSGESDAVRDTFLVGMGEEPWR